MKSRFRRDLVDHLDKTARGEGEGQSSGPRSVLGSLGYCTVWCTTDLWILPTRSSLFLCSILLCFPILSFKASTPINFPHVSLDSQLLECYAPLLLLMSRYCVTDSHFELWSLGSSFLNLYPDLFPTVQTEISKPDELLLQMRPSRLTCANHSWAWPLQTSLFLWKSSYCHPSLKPQWLISPSLLCSLNQLTVLWILLPPSLIHPFFFIPTITSPIQILIASHQPLISPCFSPFSAPLSGYFL